MASEIKDDVVPVTLKVMRLYAPKLYMNAYNSATTLIDYTGRHSNIPTSNALPVPFDLHSVDSLTSSLILPEDFGTIFVGQKFASYINLSNHSGFTLNRVGISAEIQTPNSTIPLSDQRNAHAGRNISNERPLPENPMPSFEANGNLDMIVEHTLKDMGVHILRVAVNYIDRKTSEMKSFRKFYRFSVLNPIEITPKITTISNSVFIEAQLKNMTNKSLLLHEVQFRPLSPFIIVENKIEQKEAYLDGIDIGSITEKFMKSDSIKNYIFQLKSTDANNVEFTNLGNIQVNWSSILGEGGIFISSNISRSLKNEGDIELILEAPKELILNESKEITLKIKNKTRADVHLRLDCKLDMMQGIKVYGTSSKILGVVKSDCEITSYITLLPLLRGLQYIKGFYLVDTETGQQYSGKHEIVYIV